MQVGDQSDFVTGFSRVLAETAPRIGPALSPLHFRYFCDKLAVSLCPRFYEYIFRYPPRTTSACALLLLSCLLCTTSLLAMLPYREGLSEGLQPCEKVGAWRCRCRKVSEAGSQQLLLDTQAIKALLLDFPSAGMLPNNTHHRSLLRPAPQLLDVRSDSGLRERPCL